MNKPIPISEAKKDPEIQKILDKIASGEIALSTGPELIAPWTLEEEERLKKALSKVFDFKDKKD